MKWGYTKKDSTSWCSAFFMNQNNKFPRIIENRVRINIDFFCELSYNDFVANYFVIEKEIKNSG